MDSRVLGNDASSSGLNSTLLHSTPLHSNLPYRLLLSRLLYSRVAQCIHPCTYLYLQCVTPIRGDSLTHWLTDLWGRGKESHGAQFSLSLSFPGPSLAYPSAALMSLSFLHGFHPRLASPPRYLLVPMPGLGWPSASAATPGPAPGPRCLLLLALCTTDTSPPPRPKGDPCTSLKT